MAVPRDGPRVNGPSVPAPQANDWAEHFSRIESRIDRLEKTLSAAVGLLHRVLHRERSPKPNAPAGR